MLLLLRLNSFHRFNTIKYLGVPGGAGFTLLLRHKANPQNPHRGTRCNPSRNTRYTFLARFISFDCKGYSYFLA